MFSARRLRRRIPAAIAAVALTALAVAVAMVAFEDRTPQASEHRHVHARPGARSVADLTGPRDTAPDVRGRADRPNGPGHLANEGVSTPFTAGGSAGNTPE